jgi:hypothetical protein
MKHLIIACALAAAVVAPSLFAGEPTLPTDIDTAWESRARKCTPKHGVELTITSYTKKTGESLESIDVIDDKGKNIAQLELVLGRNRAGFKLTVKSAEGWVTRDFAINEDGVTRFEKELKATLGMSLMEYYSCNQT